MLRKVEDIYGYSVRATDGDIGGVHDLYLDNNWFIRYLAVDTGSWLSHRLILISMQALGTPVWQEEVLPVLLTQRQVENSPELDPSQPLSRQQFLKLHQYYDWPTQEIERSLRPAPPSSNASFAAPPPPGTGADLEEVTSRLEANRKQTENLRLRSSREMLGYQVMSKEDQIGLVEDLFFSEDDWLIQYILLDTHSWAPDRKVLIPSRSIEGINWSAAKIFVDISRQYLDNHDATTS
jgi:uncharacterized protein YrrD